MKKIAVIGLKRNQSKTLEVLHDLGVLQIEPLSKETASLVKNEVDSDALKKVSDELLRVRSLKSALTPKGGLQRRKFSSLDELLQVSRSIDIDQKVKTLLKSKEEIYSKLYELENTERVVKELSFLNTDLSVLNLKTASSFFGKIEKDKFSQFSSLVSSTLPQAVVYSSGEDFVSFVVIVPKSSLETFGSILQKLNLKLESLPPLSGMPEAILEDVRKKKQELEGALKQVESELENLSQKYYAVLSSVEEQLSIELRKLDVMNNLGYTENVFVLEGWAPLSSLERLKRALQAKTQNTTFVYELETHEEPPTLLDNPKRFKLFESFVRFYSLPQAHEVDPTLIYSIVFPIFFGAMLGDVGYGVAILLISLWIIRRMKNRGERTIVPKFIRNFAKTIFRPTAWEKLARAMIPGSIIAIALGFLFNEYFGFRLNQYLFSYLNHTFGLSLPSSGAFLDPASSFGLKKLLLISGYIGLSLVSLGLVLGALNAYWERNKKHFIGKIGWLSIAISISLLGLALLHRQPFNPAQNPSLTGYIAGIVLGLALVYFGEGANAIIELPSIVSHILSYTRIVGILLASVILAEVIDTIFLGATHGGLAALLFGVIVLLFGQLFNLVIGLFEPGVQGARLLYVEFFSKFFRGNGRPFRPFGGRRKHTIGELEEAEV